MAHPGRLHGIRKSLLGAPADYQVRRNHSGVRCAEPAEELRLEDVPHGLGGVACRPYVHGVLEAAAFPPRWILAAEMQRRLEGTGRALADTVASQKSPRPMGCSCCEEQQVLRVEFATVRTGIREVAMDPIVGPAFRIRPPAQLIR